MKKNLTTTDSVIQITSGQESSMIWNMLDACSPMASIDILVAEFRKNATAQEEMYIDAFREALQKHRDNDPDR